MLSQWNNIYWTFYYIPDTFSKHIVWIRTESTKENNFKMCVLFSWCLIWRQNKQPHIFQRKDLPHRLGCLCGVEESDVEYGTESPWSHFIQAEQRCQQARKIYQCTRFIGLNSRDYLLPTVPQVIIKLIHLETNKFSDINKFCKKRHYLWNFLICRYASYHMGTHISSGLYIHCKAIPNNWAINCNCYSMIVLCV